MKKKVEPLLNVMVVRSQYLVAQHRENHKLSPYDSFPATTIII